MDKTMKEYSFDSIVEESNNYTISLLEHYHTLHKHGLFDTFKYDESYLSLDIIGFLSEIEEYIRYKSFSLSGYKQVSEIISVVKDLLLQLRIIEQNMFINSYKYKEIILPKLITMFLSTLELVRVNSMELLDRLQIDVAPNCTKELEKLNQLSMLFL